MMDRRELMKFFGIGATIVPVAGGEPLIRAAATLIEPARIDLSVANEDDLPRLWKSRLNDNPFERLWLARWRREEANYHILERLVGRRPTADERAVAAAMMQWFGTNCGLGFIQETFCVEGYRLSRSQNGNNQKLRDLYMQHSDKWPEFVMLRMKGGPPEMVEAL